jgi:hypothetical protein
LFSESLGNPETGPKLGSDVRFKVSLNTRDPTTGEIIRHEGVALVDMWIDLRGAITADDLKIAEESLDEIRDQIGLNLGTTLAFSHYHLSKEQEFIRVALPKYLRKLDLSPQYVWSGVAAKLERRSFDLSLRTLTLDKDVLSFGPEPDGSVIAVQILFREEQPKGSADSYDKHSYWPWVAPFVLAIGMVGAWWVPITWFGTVTALLLLSSLLAVELKMTTSAGRRWWERPPILSMAGLFGIALFGLGYAACWLVDRTSLPDAQSLGYAFLVSVGVGVAGGVIGDHAPAGLARVLAHVQLLLYLGGIAALVALLLNPRRRPGEG